MYFKISFFKYIFLIFLALFLINSLSKYDYLSLYSKYVPNYKEKYDELLNSYALMSDNYTFIPGEIIGNLDYKVSNTFYVNKGLNDNVKTNSYVVNEMGLVGVIKKVFKNYSVAKLITSNNINIAAEINDCYGTLNSGVISDLINCENININDPVFTSKYSVSSSNILIGYVSKIKDDKLYIKYSFNPYKLMYIGIIYDDFK